MRSAHVGLVVWVAAGLLLSAVVGCGGSVPAPTSFKSYNAANGHFKVDYPEGWDVTPGGKSTQRHSAAFKKGGARIKVSSNFAGSLIGGMPGGPDMPIESEEDLEEVASVHQFGLREMDDEFSNYKEEKPEVYDTSLGDGRLSEFTASGTIGGKIRGYRLTVLCNDYSVRVVCSCAADNFETLKPAFKKAMDSLERGTPEV